MDIPLTGEAYTILHVDDDPMQLELVEEYFARHLDDCTVINTTRPCEVADVSDMSLVDCLVSDYLMPETDGLDLLTSVRADYPDIPFILYTGKGSEEIASTAINEGVTGYLQKGGPDQLERLANRVEHAITQYRAKRKSERYGTVLQALNYPVYVVNADGEFEYVNQRFVDMTGYTRSEIFGAEPGLIKTAEGVQKANENLRSILSSDGPDRATFRVDIHTEGGSTIPCRDHMAVLPFTDEFDGSVGILRNVSEQEKQRQQLRNQNERLEEIVSLVSHDIRTPLAKTQAGLSLARDSGETADFNRAESGLSRIESMIDDLQELAKTGIVVDETGKVRAHRLAIDAWQTLSRTADSIETDPFTVVADADRFKSLMENLLRNAVEHTEPGVTVRVGRLGGPTDTMQPDSPSGFFVEDDGPGIPADERDRIFEAGYTTTDDGTGFGLSIIDRVAEIHGWEITATESASGGARFEVAGADVSAVERTSDAKSGGRADSHAEPGA